MYMGELLLSALVLSCSPKSDQAWSHRRWVIKSITGKCSALQEILGKEFELVEKIAERSKMNYRAWNHRCWLVSYMTKEQVLHELEKLRNWAGLHVADNCCFHYSRRLMLLILKHSKLENTSPGYSVEVSEVWKEELNWNERLIKRYIGREIMTFEDFRAQATYFATYISWLTKQIPEFWSKFQKKLTIGNLKTMLSKVCPKGHSFGIL